MHCEDLDGEVARKELQMMPHEEAPCRAPGSSRPSLFRCTARLNVRLTGERLAQHRKPARVSRERLEEGFADMVREGQKCWELLVGSTLKPFIVTDFVTL